MSIRGEEVLNSKGREKRDKERGKKSTWKNCLPSWELSSLSGVKVWPDKTYVQFLHIWQFKVEKKGVHLKAEGSSAINSKNIYLWLRLTFWPMTQIKYNVSESEKPLKGLPDSLGKSLKAKEG